MDPKIQMNDMLQKTLQLPDRVPTIKNRGKWPWVSDNVIESWYENDILTQKPSNILRQNYIGTFLKSFGHGSPKWTDEELLIFKHVLILIFKQLSKYGLVQRGSSFRRLKNNTYHMVLCKIYSSLTLQLVGTYLECIYEKMKQIRIIKRIR